MRKFIYKAIIAITYATVIAMTTLAISGIGFLIFGLSPVSFNQIWYLQIKYKLIG